MKDRIVAGLLAFFFGAFGVHKFYLGQTGAGIAYLVFCWTFIPAIVSFFEAIMLLTMNQGVFDRRFNGAALPAPPPQQIIIHNMPAPPPSPYAAYPAPGPEQASRPMVVESQALGLPPLPALDTRSSVADEIKKLNELRIAGVITEEEFRAHKQRLLT